ncbi:MAG TPA: hypothetical protein VHK22_03670 [Gaiellaceae bacterium]|jgi:hypothetical protein|nr:hypothetical protein [Gaiellaceae bacterium]
MHADPRRDEDTAEAGGLTEGLEGENLGARGPEETADGGALDEAERAGTEPARGHEAESS